jgi:hypothetical protein
MLMKCVSLPKTIFIHIVDFEICLMDLWHVYLGENVRRKKNFQ